MGKYICVRKNFTWGRLFKEGDVVELPSGTAIPYSTQKGRNGEVKKLPHFRMIPVVKKETAPPPTINDKKQIKVLKNRLAGLYGRTNLTPDEIAEKDRILKQLEKVDVEPQQVKMTKEEVVAKKEKEVESASGPRAMSMAETQAMKHKQAAEAKKKAEAKIKAKAEEKK